MQQQYGNPSITNLILFHTYFIHKNMFLKYLISLKDCPLLFITIFGIDLDKETDVILQCLQSNFNLMNALEKKKLE